MPFLLLRDRGSAASTHFYRSAVYHVASKRKYGSRRPRTRAFSDDEARDSYKHLSVLGAFMPRIHYGWVITGFSAVANTLAWSVRSTFALFHVALLQEISWGRAEPAPGCSLSWLLLLLFSPLAGLACIMMPAAAVISHWLIRSRGAAMGIVSAGSSPSVVLFYPLNAWLITSSGWRQALDAYILLGIGPLGPRNAPVLRQPLTH
jgi:hypothetical protein